MKCITIVREELERHHLVMSLPIEKRRALVSAAKQARKRGENPRAAIGRLLTIHDMRDRLEQTAKGK